MSILSRIPEPDDPIQDPRYWATRFGMLTLQAIRAHYPVDEVYHAATLAASHASDVIAREQPTFFSNFDIGPDVKGQGAA